MSLIVIPNGAMQPDGAELRQWAEQEVAAYREKQIEDGLRDLLVKNSRTCHRFGFWAGVLWATAAWMVALVLTIELRDVIADAWRAM